MKIRTKLTLRYLFVSTILVIVLFIILEETLFPQDGYDMLRILNIQLLLLWIFSFAVLFLIGYFMAKSALKPVSQIVRQVESITASNLSKRVEVDANNDEIGELATTFNHTLNRLEKSFDSQKMFVSHISHELRTPLAALIAELELSLRKERDVKDYKAVIENALNDARKIEHLSMGLLNLAKASYNVNQITISPIRIDEILMEAYAVVTKANPAYKIDLFIDNENDDDTLMTIQGNEYLLLTAFVNLIENGCKFSENKTSRIEVIVTDEDIVVSFSDNGIGIPAEEIPSLFDPFYRGSNKTYTSGNGIGLALVDKIMTMHNGEIKVESEVGKGSCFTVALKHL